MSDVAYVESAPVHPTGAALVPMDGAASEEVRRVIARVGRHLERPPRVALIGEFNTGKSTLAQALVGNPLLPASVTAHTRLPVLIHYSAKPALSVEFEDLRREVFSVNDVETISMCGARMLCLGLPIERLKSFEVVDTPGLATGQEEIDELSIEACQHSNVAVWCTAAVQAWKRTESSVWQSLPKRLRDNSVLAVTYKDALETERDAARLRARLRCEASPQFGSLILVAAPDAARACGQGAPDPGDPVWQTSGGAGFTAAINAAVTAVVAHRLACAERLLSQLALYFEPALEPRAH